MPPPSRPPPSPHVQTPNASAAFIPPSTADLIAHPGRLHYHMNTSQPPPPPQPPAEPEASRPPVVPPSISASFHNPCLHPPLAPSQHLPLPPQFSAPTTSSSSPIAHRFQSIFHLQQWLLHPGLHRRCRRTSPLPPSDPPHPPASNAAGTPPHIYPFRPPLSTNLTIPTSTIVESSSILASNTALTSSLHQLGLRETEFCCCRYANFDQVRRVICAFALAPICLEFLKL